MFELTLPVHPYPGKLIVLSGLKGAGKTTAVEEMQRTLSTLNQPSIRVKDHTPEFRQYPVFQAFLNDTDRVVRGEIDLLGFTLMSLGDSLQVLSTTVNAELQRGTTVIMDRYLMDQVAGYTLFPYEPQAFALVKVVAERFYRPDLALYIDTSPAIAMSRVVQRDGTRNRFDGQQVNDAHHAFRAFARENKWKRIDGDGSVDALRALIHVVTTDFYAVQSAQATGARMRGTA